MNNRKESMVNNATKIKAQEVSSPGLARCGKSGTCGRKEQLLPVVVRLLSNMDFVLRSNTPALTLDSLVLRVLLCRELG